MRKSINFKHKIHFKSPYLIRMDFFVGLIFTFISLQSISQVNHLDSIRSALHEKPKYLFKLDSKYSFVSNQIVSVRGGKIGLNYQDRVKFGIGYSWIKDGFKFDNPTVNVNDTLTRLSYLNPLFFMDYRFCIKKNFEVFFNTDLGLPTLGYKSRVTKKFIRKVIGFSIEPSLIAEYRFFRYFILGGGFGYRILFRTSNLITERLTAPLVIARLRIDFPLLFEKIKN